MASALPEARGSEAEIHPAMHGSARSDQVWTWGKPTASRAVGHANGRNPISILVPCHRVIGANGKLTGYAGGLDKKQWLLAWERRATGAPKDLFSAEVRGPARESANAS